MNWSYMLYLNANAVDFLNILEHPLPLAGMRSHLPPQLHMSPQMLSDPEDEDPFTSTSPQQDWVCIPTKHFADRYNVIIAGYVWCSTTINAVNNVCISTPLCSPLETPGAESPTEDEPLCTDLLTGLQFWLWEFGHSWFPGDQVIWLCIP